MVVCMKCSHLHSFFVHFYMSFVMGACMDVACIIATSTHPYICLFSARNLFYLCIVLLEVFLKKWSVGCVWIGE